MERAESQRSGPEHKEKSETETEIIEETKRNQLSLLSLWCIGGD